MPEKPTSLTIPISKMPHAESLPVPERATEGAAGMDLFAAVDAARTLPPGGRALFPTGVAMALPPGFEAQIRPRSGLAFRYGVTVLNAPGTIDADYRGEIGVLLVNFGDVPCRIEPGSRIAQLVVARHAIVQFEETENLPDTVRGDGGFGSTGSAAR